LAVALLALAVVVALAVMSLVNPEPSSNTSAGVEAGAIRCNAAAEFNGAEASAGRMVRNNARTGMAGSSLNSAVQTGVGRGKASAPGAVQGVALNRVYGLSAPGAVQGIALNRVYSLSAPGAVQGIALNRVYSLSAAQTSVDQGKASAPDAAQGVALNRVYGLSAPAAAQGIALNRVYGLSAPGAAQGIALNRVYGLSAAQTGQSRDKLSSIGLDEAHYRSVAQTGVGRGKFSAPGAGEPVPEDYSAIAIASAAEW
jgi:hypothetical protein